MKATIFKTAIKLIRSAPKVSSICADVIGDICGGVSGALSAIITMKIMSEFKKMINYFTPLERWLWGLSVLIILLSFVPIKKVNIWKSAFSR